MDPVAAAAGVALMRSHRGRRLTGWIAAVAIVVVFAQFGVVVVIVVMAVSSAAPASACPATASESLSIMGPPLSTAEGVTAWWGNRPDPPRLGVRAAELVDLYYAEGLAEGVRPELAIAQAVHETGYFSSTDTAINNYAGIGHPDGAGSGMAFLAPEMGVRAHVQLLRAYAEGNDADFASERVAPRAGAIATTALELAGTWATDPRYAGKIISVVTAIVGTSVDSDQFVDLSCTGLTGSPVSADGYSLPVDRIWYERHPEWFSKAHHDYPAADIPVPEGSPVYAMVSGVVTAAPVGGPCGLGVSYQGDDGMVYVACHGSDGGVIVGPGDRVSVGELIMHSSWSGRVIPASSAGSHLHQGVRRNGLHICPQALFEAISRDAAIRVWDLPSTGCSY